MAEKDDSLCGRMIRIKNFENTATLTQAVVELLKKSIQQTSDTPYGLVLAGGSTPMSAYAQLATQNLNASPHLHFLFSDDRYVPADSPKSNYKNIKPLFDSLQLPSKRILRIHTEFSLFEAAEQYDRDIDAFIKSGGKISLCLLGLGADGHTASLFSKEQIETGQGRWAIPVHRPDGMDGISITPACIAQADLVIFLVSGKEKRDMTKTLLTNSLSIPAGLAVKQNKTVQVWADADAWPF